MRNDALDRFLRANATALPEPFDGVTAPLALLETLAERIAGADIVALGETNHFIHEKSDFRLLFARYLLSLGWSDFVEELGWSDGHRVESYLCSGAEAELDRLPSFGYTAHLRQDRDDRPGGILKLESYPTAAFLWEQKRFYRGLRAEAARREQQVRLAGIDIDALPGGSYEDIAELLPNDAKNGDALLSALRRRPGESARAEAERLRHALTLIPPGWSPEIAEAVRALSDSLDYIAMTYGAESYEVLRPGIAFRENAMKRRLTAARGLFGTSRLVVMAHALHLAKDDRVIKGSGVGPGGNIASSLGHWLAREQQQKVVSVWLLYGGGEDCQPLASLPRRACFPAHSLNRQLARFGRPLLFFPADAPELFGEPSVVGHMYNSLIATPLAAQADAVLFLPRVTPLRTK